MSIYINNGLSEHHKNCYLTKNFIRCPTYGWSEKGKKCIIINKNNLVIPKRITLSMCITMNKNIDFTLTDSSLKSNKFINFMNEVKINTNNKFTFYLYNYLFKKVIILTFAILNLIYYIGKIMVKFKKN